MSERPEEEVLLSRLLELFSVQKISHHFGSTEKTKDAIIQEIVASSDRESIVDFVYANQSTTKHHVYLFGYPDTPIRRLPSDPLELPRLEKTESTANHRLWFFLVDLTYTVVLNDPLEAVPLHFLWPVVIRCQKNRLEMRFTIMEKDLASRFEGRSVVRALRSLDEEMITRRILNKVEIDGVRPMDLNRGVKGLWEADLIDAPSVQWKRARATTKQVMDSEYLVKRDDPALYADLADKPLFSTLFKWVGSVDASSINHFSVDPSQGRLIFRTFSDLGTGADYVVREILEHN